MTDSSLEKKESDIVVVLQIVRFDIVVVLQIVRFDIVVVLQIVRFDGVGVHRLFQACRDILVRHI